MSRPKKTFKSKEAREKHEAALAKRRARHHDAVTVRKAAQAAEGETDFDQLVEAERQRLETRAQTAGRHAGSMSPKNLSEARDNLAQAFDLMGGVPALVVWGRNNPTEFYRLWARLIPATAKESSAALPLETLLEKLATREEMSVRDAAMSVGQELLDQGRRAAELEDAANPRRPEELN